VTRAAAPTRRPVVGSSWIFTQRESDVSTTTWHYNGERVRVTGYLKASAGEPVMVSAVFPDGMDRWVWVDELSGLPSSNPALRSLPPALLARPRDGDAVRLALVALCDVLQAMGSGVPSCCLTSAAPTVTVEDIAADWLDEASGPAQAVLDGTVTAGDLGRAVRALHLWLTLTPTTA
jgi:hypothetical protein